MRYATLLHWLTHVSVYCDFASVNFSNLLNRTAHSTGAFSTALVASEMAFAITVFLQLAYLLAGRIVLRVNHSYPSLMHLALFLSTFCLISMSFVFTSDNSPGGAIANCAAFWSVCSQLRKLIGCRPRSSLRLLKSRPSCLPLFALKRGLYTRPAGLDLTCGLV